MAETTLNASITELFPCIAFEKTLNQKTQSFHQFLIDVDTTKLNCVMQKIKWCKRNNQ